MAGPNLGGHGSTSRGGAQAGTIPPKAEVPGGPDTPLGLRPAHPGPLGRDHQRPFRFPPS